MKTSITILELILTILLISILYTSFIPKNNDNQKLDELTNRIVVQLKYLRYKALIDNKNYENEEKWHKKRWSMKFLRCKNKSGIYYVIYSDENKTGQIKKDETLLDPLSKKYIYSSNACEQKEENSKYTLLTKNYDIKKINISCNTTDSLGQLSFSYNGKVYSKLSDDNEDFEITNSCNIELIDNNDNKSTIKVENNTSYIERIK